MSDTKETSRKTLTLKRTVESGHVKQSFSHGRTKPVLVEKRKKRILTRKTGETAAEAATAKPAATAKGKTASPASRPPGQTAGRTGARSAPSRPGANNTGLSAGEQDARLRALEEARKREAREAEERKRRELEERERAAREAREKAEREAELARRKAAGEPVESPQSDAPPTPSAPATDKAEQGRATARKEAQPTDGSPRPVRTPPRETPSRRHTAPELRGRRGKTETPRTPKRDEPDRFKGRLTITNALEEGGGRKPPSIARLRRKIEKQKKQAAGIQKTQVKISREVTLPEAITIQELSNRMAERAVDVIKFLMKQGQMHEINDVIDADTAELIAEEFGHTVKRVSEADVEEGFFGEEDDEADLVPRPPVVTVMGHVDHGKTSLLDAIRSSDVASGEAGGITQHIGAYQVETDGGKITFLDTPGHEAFTAMRARGAQATDIVVLVVAADDSVMPQTIEAINHARAAEVPIIVAINKIDKPDANPDKVRTELMQHEVFVESMGGDVLDVEVSALTGRGLSELLEAIQLQAELMELKANPDRPAEGLVIEARLDRGRGPVATVLVRRGTLAVGNIVVAGTGWGRVRALIDDTGRNVVRAGPSMPVEILGFNSVPEAGDVLVVVETEARAREVTEYRARKKREAKGVAMRRASLEQMMSQMKEGELKKFPVLVKADVQGSAEAIVQALQKLGNEEVQAQVVHYGVGGISESDVQLAATTGAAILGFNVRANRQASDAAQREGIEIRYYNIIYDLVDDMKQAMSGLLTPEKRETFIGNAEVLEVFNVSKVGKVAGCRVTEGQVERGAGVRLIRDDVVIHEGSLVSLKRFKDEVNSVTAGQECGMAFDNWQDIKPGDIVECYRVEEVARSL